MKRQMLIVGLCVGLLSVGLLLPAGADDASKAAPNAAPNTTKNPGFEKMKSLVGTWVAADESGKATDQVISEIKLTAGGSAIHETLFPGQPQEMLSVYTADGPDVVLTHYCVLGNQPQMKASTKSFQNTLNFEFVGGANLDPAKDQHMHGAVLTFLDDDHIQVDGTGWADGKPTQAMCHGMKLVRKK
jgi:hypothetical protein